MANMLLTTSQAASLLQVHESSVKRWTNDGLVSPAKTAGGHRRIAMGALLDLAREVRADSPLLRLQPHGVALAEATLACRELNDFGPMVDLVIRFSDHHPVHYLTDSLRYLAVAADLPIPRAFDVILAEALRRVGRQWEEGSRTVALEHRFTQKILDALHAFRAGTSPPENGPLAVIGCAETCQHEIGAMFCRVALEMEGWRTCYLGANVPFEEYAGIQASLDADLVCVSFVPPTANADARRCARILAGVYRPDRPYALALGGGALDAGFLEQGGWPFRACKVHGNVEGFVRWAGQKPSRRAMEPGSAGGRA